MSARAQHLDCCAKLFQYLSQASRCLHPRVHAEALAACGRDRRGMPRLNCRPSEATAIRNVQHDRTQRVDVTSGAKLYERAAASRSETAARPYQHMFFLRARTLLGFPFLPSTPCQTNSSCFHVGTAEPCLHHVRQTDYRLGRKQHRKWLVETRR